jgi:FMN phosphatase YigB (HAD superfamily)
MALDITQQAPESCCFIDDRALNLEVARRLGMHAVEMDGVEQLRGDLQKLGVA